MQNPSVLGINALYSRIRKYTTTVLLDFFRNTVKSHRISDTVDCSVFATPPYQPNSRAQGESHRAAKFIAADPLKDGFPQTSQFAVGFFLSHERLLLAGSSYTRR